LSERGVLSYRVLWFEKRWQEDGSFLAPHEYPEQALATASTHDLPTIAGFWAGNDIQHRADLGLLPSETIAEKLIHERALDRLHLRDRLAAEGLAAKCMPLAPADLRDAVHEFIARTRSVLAMVQIDDILGEGEQANLPGTTTEHPNWRRRLPVPIESWAGAAEFAKLVEVMGDRPTT
jgi:4-alpha-glucanotransferase